ncbi:MAG: hypothetical protein L0Z48_10640 [candidate division Zixibacteria bacterium]|nr:hypothetical protein [candidate division Zixibacteria bacterium]
MAKCKTENRYPAHYFPMRVLVVDEKTGEETAHRLNYGNGKLSVSAEKGMTSEAEEETAGAGGTADSGSETN